MLKEENPANAIKLDQAKGQTVESAESNSQMD